MNTDTEWEVHNGSGSYRADSEADAREVFDNWCVQHPHWNVRLLRIDVVRTAVVVDERKQSPLLTKGTLP